jgi:hypothetical protein
MAEDLMRWCRGRIGNNNVWPPEAQAQWLVREAREKWTEKWLGTGALKQLLDARFPPAVVPGNAAQPLGPKQPVICAHCNDNGIIRVRGKHQYCDCDLGARIRTDAGDKAKRWLERMDFSMGARPQAESHRLVKKPSLAELEAEYHKQHPEPKEDEPQ